MCPLWVDSLTKSEVECDDQCKSDTECVWNPESQELGNHSDCQPQEITDGRLGFAINSSLVIIVGILGNLLTLIAIPYVRIR